MSSTQLKRIVKVAKSTDEAIAEALAELGVGREMVEIEVLEESSKGLFGILGGKDAKVAVTLKQTPVSLATQFLDDLFFGMGIKVDVECELNGEDLAIDLSGPDMGIVIGKRGETLDAIQYLTSLVINKTKESYVKVTIDTENYRAKRKDALEALASRIADKVAKSGRRYILEPMNPYERRVIHAALQDNAKVSTYSIGEEPNRKVVVVLKGESKDRGEQRFPHRSRT